MHIFFFEKISQILLKLFSSFTTNENVQIRLSEFKFHNNVTLSFLFLNHSHKILIRFFSCSRIFSIHQIFSIVSNAFKRLTAPTMFGVHASRLSALFCNEKSSMLTSLTVHHHRINGSNSFINSRFKYIIHSQVWAIILCPVITRASHWTFSTSTGIWGTDCEPSTIKKTLSQIFSLIFSIPIICHVTFDTWDNDTAFTFLLNFLSKSFQSIWKSFVSFTNSISNQNIFDRVFRGNILEWCSRIHNKTLSHFQSFQLFTRAWASKFMQYVELCE